MAEPVLIPIADIETVGLIRRPRPARVAAIAASIAAEGQETPIEVAPHRKEEGRQIYRLTKGWVRLQALSQGLQRTEVLARVRRVASAQERIQRGVDDNLLGDGCTVLDRARYLTLRKGLYEQDHPGASHGGDRRSGEQVAKSGELKFSVWAAQTYGGSVRAVERSCTIGERLDPHAAEALADTDWADHQAALETIARLQPVQQQAVARLLTREPDPVATLADAIAQVVGAPVVAPVSKAFSAFYGGYCRLGARDRRDALRQLVDDGLLPTGVKIVFETDEAAQPQDLAA